MTKRNNADYGMSLQQIICNEYGLFVNETAAQQFSANYNSQYYEELQPLSHEIFNQLGAQPIELLTYTKKLINNKQTTCAHNFLLSNGETLSIRTTKTSNKIAPRTIGQGGFNVLNDYFSDINGKSVKSQEEVREMIFNHIHEMLPIFIDCLFQSDYTVLINRNLLSKIIIIKAKDLGQFSFDRKEFSFTRDLSLWTESTTLKYNGKSIAEIQTHRERTFKFRFLVSAIPEWIQLVKVNNETLGISAEAAICKYFRIKQPLSFASRSSGKIISDLIPVIDEAFKGIPKVIKHTGSEAGARGAQSKCPYDFVLDGNLTLSLKTNKGKMVCPPEVGQPSADTCFKYFKHFLPSGSESMTNESFKNMVFNHIEEMIPIYFDHLFDSNFLLWIYQDKEHYNYKVIDQQNIQSFKWIPSKFSFTKSDTHSWNESNTVKYDGVTIGEFQIHTHRSCFKFRFHLANLLELIET